MEEGESKIGGQFKETYYIFNGAGRERFRCTNKG